VITVDHDRVGQLDARQGVDALRTDQLELGPLAVELDQPLLRRGIDREHRGAGPGGPIREHARQISRERADFRHRSRLHGVQARKDDLGHLHERHPPLVRVVKVGVELGRRGPQGGECSHSGSRRW
jgi:hypothetical protein